MQAPDILFLDEPTNHLDIDGILWLEKLLQTAPFACVVVSHDRFFLENVVNDMAELNRVYPEGLFRVEGNYSRFLEKKEEFLRGAVAAAGGAGQPRAARGGMAAPPPQGAHRQIARAHRRGRAG